MVTLIESDDDWTKLRAQARAANKPLIVQFSATWCGPCKRIYPDFERLSQQAQSHAIFAKVNVDAAEQATADAGVSAMPTFQAYHNDQLLESLRGANREKLVELVTRTLQHLVVQNTDDAAAVPAPPAEGQAETASEPQPSAVPQQPQQQPQSPPEQQDFAGKVVLIDSDLEWEALVQYAQEQDQPIVAQFSATWCAPCKRIYPIFGQHCRQNAGRALFAKVDVDGAQGITAAAGVSGVPAFLGLCNGHVVDAFCGADQAHLTQLVDATVARRVPQPPPAAETDTASNVAAAEIDYPENEQPVHVLTS